MKPASGAVGLKPGMVGKPIAALFASTRSGWRLWCPLSLSPLPSLSPVVACTCRVVIAIVIIVAIALAGLESRPDLGGGSVPCITQLRSALVAR